jgi:hypothetical protein
MRSARLILLALLVSCAHAAPPIPVPEGSSLLHVPDEYPTIQAAVDRAADGDVVVVAPGRYRENVAISGKHLTLGSWFLGSGSTRDVKRTRIHGTVFVANVEGGRAHVVGLTIADSGTGVDIRKANVEVRDNRILHHRREGIGVLNSRVEIRNNLIRDNGDDGVDSDGANELLIEGNEIASNVDDGIEIRLHPYEGDTLTLRIRNNRITGSGEDGVQIIDYPGRSDRVIHIERNYFRGTHWAGIGSMANGQTQENLAGAPMEEPVFVVNNTFERNRVGVTGGHNMLVLNNVFANSGEVALRHLRENSIAAYDLFWRNARDLEDVIRGPRCPQRGDPRLDGDGHLRGGSAAIDAGTAAFEHGELAAEIPAADFSGSAPDLGAYELRP